MRHITIKTPKGKRRIGPGEPVFIVAEMSGNHNQSLKRAMEIIDAAALAKVDAIKFQTYTPDTMTLNCDNDYFRVRVNNVWKDKILYKLYEEAYTPWKWQAKLKKYAERKGLVVFSTPFDETAVDFLEKLKIPLYKVASYEITDLPLLEKIGKTKKPVILARGMASAKEISLAIKTLQKSGTKEIAVLHCVSIYPADPSKMNLKTIPDIAKRFGVVSGLSDHSLGINVSLGAVVLGASIIEKHMTLARSDGGPDSSFSLEPKEFASLVKSVREVESSLGKPNYARDKEEEIGAEHRRSLFAVSDIKMGEKFTKKNVRCIRPAFGLAPENIHKVMGMTAKKDIERGTPLEWKHIRS